MQQEDYEKTMQGAYDNIKKWCADRPSVQIPAEALFMIWKRDYLKGQVPNNIEHWCSGINSIFLKIKRSGKAVL